ncbi:alpha/beta fold hydrolase [Hahella ganghwensis]|uniref:alpha/beta fold hydrolase n=1 Tax=Hahella ganghwensis TaxID=286420 RepID=UPI00037E177D|nr:alpha/beta hydrolase [Hahella ganghwensis]
MTTTTAPRQKQGSTRQKKARAKPAGRTASSRAKVKRSANETEKAIRHLRVDANGTSFHVAVASPAPSDSTEPPPEIFCLHGFPEGWQSWRQLMDYLPEAKIYAPDLRGYPTSEYPRNGYDVFTLTDDIRELMARLDVKNPILLTHDWGGALGWIFAHRFSDLISRLIVVNCTHPKTLVRAVFQLDDWQTFRIPWVLPFQPPVIPELLLTTAIGRRLLELSFTLREGPAGNMNRKLVREMVDRYQHRRDLRGAIEYYREIVKTLINPAARKMLEDVYQQPIQTPTTLVWGMRDLALSSKVAQKSEQDAGCPVEWRPLSDIGHFVDLEAPELLAHEVRRVLKKVS